MSGLETLFWRGRINWPATIALAEAVLARWNSVTVFVTHTDQRERIWTVRHNSVAQPFLVISQDSMNGTAPRIGNPLAALLLLGMSVANPDALDLSFANGQKIDASKFELADLTTFLPHATHAAHRKLAELALTPPAA